MEYSNVKSAKAQDEMKKDKTFALKEEIMKEFDRVGFSIHRGKWQTSISVMLDIAIRKTQEAEGVREQYLNTIVKELQSKIKELENKNTELINKNYGILKQYLGSQKQIKELENNKESSRLAIAELHRDLKKCKSGTIREVEEMIDKFANVGGCNCAGGDCDQCVMNIRIKDLKQQLKRLE